MTAEVSLQHQNIANSTNTKYSELRDSTKSSPIFTMSTSIDRPRTPDQPHTRDEYDTPRRAAYLWHASHKRDDETWSQVAHHHQISSATGRRWRRAKLELGSPTAIRRTRKLRAEQHGTKLGRPPRISAEVLSEMVSESNPVATQSLPDQAEHYNLEISKRSLRRNLSRREEARLYVAAYTGDLRENNILARLKYAKANCDRPLLGFWDTVYFTDEAHFNPTERL